RSFAFSSASREVLREACTQSTPAWVGDFVEIDDAIKVTGLDRLYDALTHREQACDRSDETAERALFYGSWLRHLRV
ncbi:hypothetical protein ABTP03_19885, partial [Acinetobacter baumannii]